MKKFALSCTEGHTFSGWFSSQDALCAALMDHALACPHCGCVDVTKSLQMPNVPARMGRSRSADGGGPVLPSYSGKSRAVAPQSPSPSPELVEKFAQLYTAVKKIQEHVEKNFDDVGKGFATEARKIHEGEATSRGIVGQARKEEVEELLEDGIAVLPLPSLPKPDA